MGYQFPQDIQEWIGAKVASGQYGSEDDLLRDALRALDEEQEDLAAVQEAVAQWRAGDEGLPLDEAFDAIRNRHLH